MAGEQLTTLDSIRTAIQMEIDGKAFYLKSANLSGNELGKKLFTSLAAEEDIHRHVFENIYQAISAKQKWPVVNPEDHLEGIRTLVASETRKLGSNIKPAKTELDAVETAMGLEDKTYDFYKQNGAKASYPAEKELYQKLASQEASHKLVLSEYYEYLLNPAAYFVKMEHHSLDGG